MSLLKYIASEVSLQIRDIVAIAVSAPFRYKEYQIPKRSKGYRKIAQPSREVKLLQKACISWLQEKLPVHESATAYVKGIGIRKNAEQHVNSKYLLKLDFKNFFPSINPSDFKSHFNKHSSTKLSEDELKLLIRILFWKPKDKNGLVLSIGAPSSPFISNSIMYDFDILVSDFANDKNISYTRYADDLTFSGNSISDLYKIQNFINQKLSKLVYPKLRLNQEKTVLVSKRFNRTVTGLVLSNDNKVSLGRDRKRIIRSSIHNYTNGNLSGDEVATLRGWLAFALDVEPEFYYRMVNKYGENILRKILKW